MKKLFLTVALLIAITGFTQAQTMDKAIGIRATNGAELSYQNPLTGSTRLEVDLGLYRSGSFFLTGIHQWVFDLSSLSNGFNWYVGLGPQLGIWDNGDRNSDFALGLAAQIGIEYNFNIPLQLSLDYRPGWMIIPSGADGMWDGVALGIRYRF